MLPERALRQRFALSLSAASGIVVRDGIAWVIGDDRVGLDRYDLADGSALAPLLLLAGHDAHATLSKPEKPDLEALAVLGDGTLVVLGSGSRPNRDRGFRIDAARGDVRPIDLSPLYTRLRRDIADLNIEGAALDEGTGTLVLAHRGVGRTDASALIRLDARTLPDAAWPASALRGVQSIDVGALDGVALAFTDLAAGPDGVLHFLAAAEDTDDPYRDGHCRGSVLGRLERDGTARALARLAPNVKAEGLAYSHRSGDEDVWLVVTDADDPGLCAKLYDLRIPAV